MNQNLQPVLPDSIDTTRLTVRRYSLTDAAWYHAMSRRNQAHLAQFEGDNPVMNIFTRDDAEGVMRSFVEAWDSRESFFFAVFVRTTQEFAGQIYLGVSNRAVPECEIGYFAEVEHQGKGYISEAVCGVLDFAFNEVGAQRVRLECDDTNLPSVGVAERCGFRKEGHIRQNKRHPNGSLTGTLFYGMLRREFNQVPKEG